ASCPHQASRQVEVRVAEMRRAHPRWGANRIRLGLLRNPSPGAGPSVRTINRILGRPGFVLPGVWVRRRGSCRGGGRGRAGEPWERGGAMGVWEMDIGGGVMLVDPVPGVVREAKVVTAVDDHSRFCVIAAVTERATARAVCLAFTQALARFGVPEEIITDN